MVKVLDILREIEREIYGAIERRRKLINSKKYVYKDMKRGVRRPKRIKPLRKKPVFSRGFSPMQIMQHMRDAKIQGITQAFKAIIENTGIILSDMKAENPALPASSMEVIVRSLSLNPDNELFLYGEGNPIKRDTRSGFTTSARGKNNKPSVKDFLRSCVLTSLFVNNPNADISYEFMRNFDVQSLKGIEMLPAGTLLVPAQKTINGRTQYYISHVLMLGDTALTSIKNMKWKFDDVKSPEVQNLLNSFMAVLDNQVLMDDKAVNEYSKIFKMYNLSEDDIRAFEKAYAVDIKKVHGSQEKLNEDIRWANKIYDHYGIKKKQPVSLKGYKSWLKTAEQLDMLDQRIKVDLLYAKSRSTNKTDWSNKLKKRIDVLIDFNSRYMSVLGYDNLYIQRILDFKLHDEEIKRALENTQKILHFEDDSIKKQANNPHSLALYFDNQIDYLKTPYGNKIGHIIGKSLTINGKDDLIDDLGDKYKDANDISDILYKIIRTKDYRSDWKIDDVIISTENTNRNFIKNLDGRLKPYVNRLSDLTNSEKVNVNLYLDELSNADIKQIMDNGDLYDDFISGNLNTAELFENNDDSSDDDDGLDIED